MDVQLLWSIYLSTLSYKGKRCFNLGPNKNVKPSQTGIGDSEREKGNNVTVV